jgi:two-component system, OmpR family, phosphate regulon sensor histidine kinase PhoR
MKFWPWQRNRIAGEGAAAPAAPPLLEVTAILDGIPEAITVLDRGFRVLSVNARCAELTGAVAGQPITALLRSPELLRALKTVTATGKPMTAAIELRGPVEQRFEATVSPVGNGDSLLVYLRDLTVAEKVERMRVNFIADVSHELRTPLTSIVGFVETMQGAAKNDAKAQANFLEIVHAQASRMQRLINDLLSLSRIELSEHQLPNGTVDLAVAAGSVADALATVAAKEGVELHRALDGNVVVAGARDELVQAIQNLVENAIKYGAEGKRVELSVKAENAMGIVEVRDFGPGIPELHMARLTERFYRIDQEGSRKKSGTGLGLAIVKHIVNRHRGRLAIRSESGRGAVFSIAIPLAKSKG